MSKEYYIYLLTNKHCNVLYTGVTNNLMRRIYEHKNKLQKGFTKKYNVDRLCIMKYMLTLLMQSREKNKSRVGYEKRKMHLWLGLIRNGKIFMRIFEEEC